MHRLVNDMKLPSVNFRLKCLTIMVLFASGCAGASCFAQDPEPLMQAEPPVSFVMGVLPTSLFISPEKRGFSVTSPDEMQLDDVVNGISFNVPAMKFGLGFNSRLVQLDLMAGAGYLMSGMISGVFLSGDAYCRFRLSPVVSFGLHAGIMNYTPRWDPFGYAWSDPGDVRFSRVSGLLVGPSMSFGKRTAFTLSLDYATGETDVRTANGFRANRSRLELGGLMLNYGLLVRLP